MTDVSAAGRRRRDRLAFWALAAFALFVAHDAVYLVQVGPGELLDDMLRSAGHGYWGWASIGLTLAALTGGAWAWLRIRRLRHAARELGTAPAPIRPFARRLAIHWWRLAAVVAIGFAIQENVEHLVAHGHALGAGALVGPEYPLALPVIGLVSAIAAALAALVAGTQEALATAIEAALRRPIRRTLVPARRPAGKVAASGSVLAHPGAGRAPPTLRLVPHT